MQQLRKWSEVPSNPVVKARILEREDLALPSYDSGTDVLCSVDGQTGDSIVMN